MGKQFRSLAVLNSLWPHGLQHTRLPCPSPTPRACPNSCPLSQWCHPTISSSVIPFSSCLQSFPASGSFQMSQFFTSGGQSIKSFSFNISPSNEYSELISFRMDWLDLLAVQGTLKSLLQHHSWKASILLCSAFFIVQLSQPIETASGRRERRREDERKKSEMVRDREKQVYLLNMRHSQEKTKNISQYALCSIVICVNTLIKLTFTLYV